jgi:fibronectin type 3 domain-containing protein
MSAKKTVFTTFVLLALCALVVGCGDDSVAPTTDEAPILPPQNLVVTQTPNMIRLAWDANPQGNLAGYNVYRMEGGSGVLVKMTHTPILANYFEDASVQPSIGYQYRVTSVTTNDKESPYALVSAALHGVAKEKREKPYL